MRAFAEWLYGTSPSAAIHSAVWVVRLLQATHLLTAAVAAGSGIMIALRAIGWQRVDESFAAVWTRFAPWLGASLAVMAATGLAQTVGDPVRELMSTSYWVKLALLAGCVVGSLALARAARTGSGELSRSMKLIAVALVLAWLALPLLGRMIGYDAAIWGSWSLRA